MCSSDLRTGRNFFSFNELIDGPTGFGIAGQGLGDLTKAVRPEVIEAVVFGRQPVALVSGVTEIDFQGESKIRSKIRIKIKIRIRIKSKIRRLIGNGGGGCDFVYLAVAAAADAFEAGYVEIQPASEGVAHIVQTQFTLRR